MSYTSRDPRPLGKDYYSAPRITGDVPWPSHPTLTSLTAFRHPMIWRGRVVDATYVETISRVLDKGETEQEKGLAKVFVKSIKVTAHPRTNTNKHLTVDSTHQTTEQSIDIAYPLFITSSAEWFRRSDTPGIGGNLRGRILEMNLDELNYVEDGIPHKGIGVENKGGWLTRDYLRTGTPNYTGGGYTGTALLNLPYEQRMFAGQGLKMSASGLHETIDRKDQGEKASFNLNYLFEHVSRRYDRGGALNLLYPTRGHLIEDSKGSGSAVESVTTENQRKMEPLALAGVLASILFKALSKFLLVKIGLAGFSVWGFITGLLPSFGFFGLGGLMAKVATFFGAIKAGVLGALLGPVMLVFGKLIAIVMAVFAFIMKIVAVVSTIEVLTSPFSAWLQNKIREKDRDNYWSSGSILPTRLRNSNLIWNGDSYRVKQSNQFIDLQKTTSNQVKEQQKAQYITLPINKLYANLDEAVADIGVDREAIRHIDYVRFADSDYMHEQDEHLKEIANEF